MGNHNMLMVIMTSPGCLKWPETTQPRPGRSGDIDQLIMFVLISNFTQILGKLGSRHCLNIISKPDGIPCM